MATFRISTRPRKWIQSSLRTILSCNAKQLSKAMAKGLSKALDKRLSKVMDQHLSPAGHELMVQTIMEALDKAGQQAPGK